MISHQDVTTLYVTLIHDTFDVDCFFPNYSDAYIIKNKELIKKSKSLEYQFLIYSKKNKK